MIVVENLLIEASLAGFKSFKNLKMIRNRKAWIITKEDRETEAQRLHALRRWRRFGETERERLNILFSCVRTLAFSE